MFRVVNTRAVEPQELEGLGWEDNVDYPVDRYDRTSEVSSKDLILSDTESPITDYIVSGINLTDQVEEETDILRDRVTEAGYEVEIDRRAQIEYNWTEEIDSM